MATTLIGTVNEMIEMELKAKRERIPALAEQIKSHKDSLAVLRSEEKMLDAYIAELEYLKVLKRTSK